MMRQDLYRPAGENDCDHNITADDDDDDERHDGAEEKETFPTLSNINISFLISESSFVEYMERAL